MPNTTPVLKLPYPADGDQLVDYPATAQAAAELLDKLVPGVNPLFPPTTGTLTWAGPRLGNWETLRGSGARLGPLVVWSVELRRSGAAVTPGSNGDVDPNLLCLTLSEVSLRPTQNQAVWITGTRFVGAGHVEPNGDVYLDALGNGSQPVSTGLGCVFSAAYIAPR